MEASLRVIRVLLRSKKFIAPLGALSGFFFPFLFSGRIDVLDEPSSHLENNGMGIPPSANYSPSTDYHKVVTLAGASVANQPSPFDTAMHQLKLSHQDGIAVPRDALKWSCLNSLSVGTSEISSGVVDALSISDKEFENLEYVVNGIVIDIASIERLRARRLGKTSAQGNIQESSKDYLSIDMSVSPVVIDDVGTEVIDVFEIESFPPEGDQIFKAAEVKLARELGVDRGKAFLELSRPALGNFGEFTQRITLRGSAKATNVQEAIKASIEFIDPQNGRVVKSYTVPVNDAFRKRYKSIF